jgi:branched-chain amino acid transport system substrate-binding protein
MVAAALAVSACSSSNKNGSSSPTTSPPTSGPAGSSGSGGSTGGGSASPTGSPIVIGGICSCTSAIGNLTGELNPYKAWVATVNASGGINGHPVRFISFDDKGNPGLSLADVKTLVQSDHVIAVVDATNVDEGWASYIESTKIPVVGGSTSTTPFFMNPDFYPESQTEDGLFPSIIETAKTAKATNLALVYCAEAIQCQEGIAPLKQTGQALGLPVTVAVEVSAAAPSYAAQCLAAQQAHITTVFVADIFTVVDKVASDCAQQGYNPTYVVDGLDLAQSFTGVKGTLYATVPDLPYYANTAATQTMNAAFDKYYPGMRTNAVSYNEIYASMWVSGLLFADAAKAGGLGANGSTPTSAQLVTGLESLKADTLGGLAPPLTFAANQPHPIHCWFESLMKGGTFSLPGGTTPVCVK